VIVKVCGVSTAEVAEAAVDAGADWIGMVFVPGSPRHLEAPAARRVAAAVGGAAELIGVLVAPSVEHCDELAERYRLAAVQVHGEVRPELAADSQVPVIRGINIHTQVEALLIDWWADALILLDAAGDGDALPGGTGRRLPTEWAAPVARHRRIVLAGGLGPDSVADAIARVRPYGVDASSGLESAPGVKEVSRVRAYVRAARAAFDLFPLPDHAAMSHG
jgi:phosphoribosylanthranilate isomerase